MNRCDIFISQLDSLVIFLAAAHKEVFQTIKQHELTWSLSTPGVHTC